MDSFIIFSQIILVNLLLSGDNAIIIAMVSKQLPEKSRNLAIWLGTIIAVMMRILFIFIAVPLLSIPYLQATGGLLLLYIAIKLLADLQGTEQPAAIVKSITLTGAIWTIITADLVMSLDNVLAIAAVARGDFVLIMLGIMISIPIIIWGSKLLNELLKRFPSVGYIGAACLGYAAGEMIIKDKGLQLLILYKLGDRLMMIPLLCIPIVIIIALIKLRLAQK